MQVRRIFGVNGYGASKDPVNDGNLDRYLRRIVDDAERERPDRIWLYGGYTNRTDLSEAEAMRQWFVCHAPHLLPIIEVIDATTSARENVYHFLGYLQACRYFNEDVGLKVTYYCEWTRRFETRLHFAWLSHRDPGVRWSVRGVKFAEDALEPKTAFARYFYKTPQTILAEFSSSIRERKQTEREAHLARERARSER